MTATEWYGGRQSRIVYEDDWEWCNTWEYTRDVDYPGVVDDRWPLKALRACLVLTVHGSMRQNRLRPTCAMVQVKLLEGPTLDLHESPVKSIRLAQKWADQFATLAVLKLALKSYYQGHRVLIENNEGGWAEWYTSFDEHPNWNVLLGFTKECRISKATSTAYITKSGSGWTRTSTPTRLGHLSEGGLRL